MPTTNVPGVINPGGELEAAAALPDVTAMAAAARPPAATVLSTAVVFLPIVNIPYSPVCVWCTEIPKVVVSQALAGLELESQLLDPALAPVLHREGHAPARRCLHRLLHGAEDEVDDEGDSDVEQRGRRIK